MIHFIALVVPAVLGILFLIASSEVDKSEGQSYDFLNTDKFFR